MRRSAVFVDALFPALQQAAVKPVPQDVEDSLDGTIGCIGNGNTKTEIGADVLAPAERDLELRHDVPVCSRVGAEVPVGDEFRHRGPHPAKAVALAKTLTKSRTPEHRAGHVRS